jgi:hypothetical protein
MDTRPHNVGRLLSAGAHVLVGSSFAVDGALKLAAAAGTASFGAGAAIIAIAGALELVGGALVAARSRATLAPGVSNSWSFDRRTHEA